MLDAAAADAAEMQRRLIKFRFNCLIMLNKNVTLKKSKGSSRREEIPIARFLRRNDFTNVILHLKSPFSSRALFGSLIDISF
jgi:hypothetical protein